MKFFKEKIFLFFKILYDFLFPLVSVWFIVALIRISNYLHTKKIFPTVVVIFFVIPVVIFEIFFTKCFYKNKSLLPKKAIQKIGLLGRITFWCVLFFLWAIFMPLSEDDRLWLEFVHFSFVPMTAMILIAESFLSYMFFFVWIFIYYFITVRKRILRMATSLFLPIFFVSFLFYDYYFIGGIGKLHDVDIESQKGVEIIFKKKDFISENEDDLYWWEKELHKSPREIHFDKKRNCIFTNYASTYGDSSGVKCPSILKIDISSKKVSYFSSFYSRTFFATEDTILILPWFDYKIYEISKEDLKLIREIPAQTDIWPLEVLDIRVDSKKKHIYVFNDMRPAIFIYDYKSGKLLNYKIFWELKYSGCVWNPQFDEENKKMYVCVFGGKDDIWEIDMETLEVLRGIDIVWYGGSQMVLDKENELIYFQDGATDRLFEIDIESFKIKRILDGEVHSRAIYLDKKRNFIYLLSYFFGRLKAIDLNTGKKVFAILVGGKPYGMCVEEDEGIIYINSVNGIVKVKLDEILRNYVHYK